MLHDAPQFEFDEDAEDCWRSFPRSIGEASQLVDPSCKIFTGCQDAKKIQESNSQDLRDPRRGIAAGIKLTMDFRPAFELKGRTQGGWELSLDEGMKCTGDTRWYKLIYGDRWLWL